MSDHATKLVLRWTAIILLFVLGIALVLCSVLVPSHLRAVDVQVVMEAGRATSTLVDEAIRSLNAGMLSQARLFQSAAQQCGVTRAQELERVLQESARWQAGQAGVSELDFILRNDAWAQKWDGRPVVQLLAGRTASQAVRKHLEQIYRSGVQEILKTRTLTTLRHFSPADSAAGQPYEAAGLLAGLLVAQDGLLPSSLRDGIESLAYGAVRRNEVEPLELFYVDLVTLGNRMNWGQLTGVLKNVADPGMVRDLAAVVRQQTQHWQTLAAAVLMHGSAGEVTAYLRSHTQTGMNDLLMALRHGQGALRTLVQSRAQAYDPVWRNGLLAYEPFYTVFITWLGVAKGTDIWGLVLKYGLLVISAFLLSRVVVDLMPEADGIAVKRWGSPAHWVLFGILVISVFAVIEPFLFKPNLASTFPPHWKFPRLGEGLGQTVTNKLILMMDLLTILSLVLFLVVQGTIYLVCLLKLAEIRRQQVPSRIKLRLLENEENMFDMGLYCGLGGTVAALILLTLGIIKPSLMAAYSSTLFGIIFVAVLKVFHLRPFRRQLIIDAELWNADE